MIYDTFLYNGEKDMLELRYTVLQDVVDEFIPIVCNRTFRGDLQRIEENYLGEFQWVHLPKFNSPWVTEQCARNSIMSALVDLKPDDMVLIGDVDEIPDPNNLRKVGSHVMENFIYRFECKKMKRPCTISVLGKTILDGILPHQIRNEKNNLPFIFGGAHLCNFFMSPEEISKKIQSFSHEEFDKPEFTDPEMIRDRMSRGVDLFERNDPEEIVYHDGVIPPFLEEPYARFLASRGK